MSKLKKKANRSGRTDVPSLILCLDGKKWMTIINVSAETDEEGEVMDMTSSEESDSQTDNSEGTLNHLYEDD